MTIAVRCDDCAWNDTVSSLRHLRAWYRVACPSCGCGEVIDERERLVLEEVIALEAEGLVTLCGATDDPGPGKVRMNLNTAREPMLTQTPHLGECLK